MKKLLSLLLTICLLVGAAPAFAQSADFEALMPLMDLVSAAALNSPNAPESVPGADGTLSETFVDAFIKIGQEWGAQLGITADMLANPSAQADLLGKLFAAQLPELKTVEVEEIAGYTGFHPVTVNTMDDAGVQIIGEVYLAEKPMAQLSEAEYTSIQWLDRAVFTFQSDASAQNGFRLTGFSVGTDLTFEDALQGYFEEICVEYESKLGFSLLYPAVFDDTLLTEDESGVSAQLADGSASFFARREENVNGALLADYVAAAAAGLPGSRASVHEDMQYATLAYTADGYAVFNVYIVTADYVYEAQLKYLVSLMSEYSMYNAYLENSFGATELSQG